MAILGNHHPNQQLYSHHQSKAEPRTMRETVYQFSNPSVGTNLFTTSASERDAIINNSPDFNFLGPSYFGADPANQDSSPVFRFFNQTTGAYFYTVSEAEKDDILANRPEFVLEGTAFSAFATDIAGTEPVYRFFNPDTNTHFFTASETERQSLEADPSFQFEQVAFYTLPIASETDTPPSEDPIANIGTGIISGLVFEDRNRSGVQDSELIQGANPDLIFVIDVSRSTGGRFDGIPVGDVNGDGSEDDILDAELAAFIGLNQQLRQQGSGDNVDIGIVVFAETGVSANMIPGSADPNLITGEQQFTITPNTDGNNNGIFDVEEILRSLVEESFGVVPGTDFEEGLLASERTLDSIGTPAGEGNIIFLSDGGSSISEDEEVLVNLRNNGVNISAFGVGENADIENLRVIDPDAQIFTSTDEFLSAFGVIEGGDGEQNQSRLEPGQEEVQVYLDINNNGTLDANEPVQLTDADGLYQFTDLAPGNYTVRQVLPDGFELVVPQEAQYTVELEDDQTIENLNFGNAVVSRDNFTGAEVEIQVFAPDLSTPITNPVSTTAGDGVEFNDLSTNAIDDAEVIDINIDVAATQITFTVDQLTETDDGNFANDSFNGYRITDISDSINSITNVTLDQSATTLGLTAADINFTENTIEVNFAGVDYIQGDTAVLNVEFGDI